MILLILMIQMNWLHWFFDTTTVLSSGDGTIKSFTKKIRRRYRNIPKEIYLSLWFPPKMRLWNNPCHGLSLIQSKVSDIKEMELYHPTMDTGISWNPEIIVLTSVFQSTCWNIYHLSLIHNGNTMTPQTLVPGVETLEAPLMNVRS